MHSDAGALGGDLRRDTVAIIGGALDLQEKVVKQAMTPIENVFMLSIDARLDFNTLRKVCKTGHSRIPVYEEVDIPAPMAVAGTPLVRETGKGVAPAEAHTGAKTIKAKKIVGILLVKQCVLLDPADATPVRKIPLNKVPVVPHNEPLLGILDKFQEGRSHMAIVSHFSAERAQSVKKAVKQGLTQRLRSAIRDTDSEDESSSSSSSEDEAATSSQKRWHLRRKKSDGSKDNASTGSTNTPTLHESPQGGSEEEGSSSLPKKIRGLSARGKRKHRHKSKHAKPEDVDLELGAMQKDDSKARSILPGFSIAPSGKFWGREQYMPADAVLSTEGAEELLQIADPAVMPLGIITLEDVLEGASYFRFLSHDLTGFDRTHRRGNLRRV